MHKLELHKSVLRYNILYIVVKKRLDKIERMLND